jgi:hypothetical protein
MKGSVLLWLVVGVLVILALAPFITKDISSETYKVTEARSRVNACLEANVNAAYPHSRKMEVAAIDCLASGYCSVSISTTNEQGDKVHAMLDPKREKVFLDKSSRPIALESEASFDVFGADMDRIDRGVHECFGFSLKEIIRRALDKHFDSERGNDR